MVWRHLLPAACAPSLAFASAFAPACAAPQATDDPPSTLALRVESFPSPAGPGARWPTLAEGPNEGLTLVWTSTGANPSLRLSTWSPDRASRGSWSKPESVTSLADAFVNWADFPQIAVGADGTRTVAWLELMGRGTYAYGVRFTRRGPAGGWESPRWLHDDRSPKEHGFVSLTALPAGGVHAVWLDGRYTGEDEDGLLGSMTVRARTIAADGSLGPERELDERVCDCCQTDAAVLADGRILAAWRDRTEGEVRDISWAVGPTGAGAWSPAQPLADDGWHIIACPVNGPALATSGDSAAAAWFTLGSEGNARVLAAFAAPDLAGFGEPLRVDDGRGLGRVDVLLLDQGRLLVIWLESVGVGAEWRARLVERSGRRGESVLLATVAGERGDGFARLVRAERGALVAFVDREADGLALRLLIPADD